MIRLRPEPAPTRPASTCKPTGPGGTDGTHPGGVSGCHVVHDQCQAPYNRPGRHAAGGCLTLLQGLAQVVEQVVAVLDAHRQPDQVGRDLQLQPATEACVIRAGCSISDSTPPSDSPRVNSQVRPQARTSGSR